VRVFYDVDIAGEVVEILAIVAKAEADQWLAEFGEPE
jgi:mRNA interferase RelE/StbE